MESEKFFFKKETPQNIEFQENEKKELREVYINDVFLETKDRLEKYFPSFYREIPTKLNYQDNSEDLKINYHFEGEELNINIKTPENLSKKTINELNKTESNFLVFKNVAENEIISKKCRIFSFCPTNTFMELIRYYSKNTDQILLK